jgi:hypothetical protein
MTDTMEMFDYIPDTCQDNLTEMVTYNLLAGEDSLGNGDENNNNYNETAVNNNNYNRNMKEKLKSADDSGRNKFTGKAKRGRPCAKSPTKETLRRRRKVVC